MRFPHLAYQCARVSPTQANAPRPWTSAKWTEHFQTNETRLVSVPWQQGVAFTKEQYSRLAALLQQFQLGESGEGHHLIDCARQYAARTGDLNYVQAVRRFIAEEQRHALDLGRVLDLAGIPRIKSAWPDTIFRFLRRGAGLELSISILVTAEIIAKIYYASVREASSSLVLRRLCDQILYDEQEHVRFQCERLAILRQSVRRWALSIRHGLHRVLFAGTCIAVWWKHASAFRAGGCGCFDFFRAAWEDLERAIVQMGSSRYAFAAAAQGGAALRHSSLIPRTAG